MIVPEEIRDQIRDLIWSAAEDLGWSELSDVDRARHYETWTRDPRIGGRLAHFMDPRKVRVYIKDSLLKPYERRRLSLTEGDVWPMLGLSPPEVGDTFIKPHGRRLVDGRVVCWGKSRDWKLILMAAFERAATKPGSTPYAVVLLESGKTSDPVMRELVREAGRRLGVARLEWIE